MHPSTSWRATTTPNAEQNQPKVYDTAVCSFFDTRCVVLDTEKRPVV